MATGTLPIETVLPELLDHLENRSSAVLVASPGAGKTTRVPRALLDASWRRDNRILVLEPRRLAARTAARRMASMLGEKPGETVGYRVRMESRVSTRTRIEVITEGVFTRMILDDPELSGVAAVLFDEFHERSLDSDLGLALALETQSVLRDDLRILVMSATLDARRVAELMGQAPVVESQGRAFPIETRYLGRAPRGRLEDDVAAAVFKAIDEETGSILVFLPGQAEIRRVAERLSASVSRDTLIAPLYSALPPRQQDAAIRPSPPGQRKIVLATSIAQTSLTIEGIRVVIDSGLARVPRYEPSTGLTRLETRKAARSAADQRRGRAGRTEPGVCYRLWDEAQTRALPPHETAEILEADLTGLALDLAVWGTRDPADLAWLDAPPSGAWQEACALLRALDALDEAGAITQAGRAMARLPLHPRLSHMLVCAEAEGLGSLASEIAALLGERGLGGQSTDLRERVRVFRRDTSPRARDARAMASRWIERITGAPPRNGGDFAEIEACGRVLAHAYPDRVAQARGAPGGFRLANGRGGALDASDALAREAYLCVAEMQGSAKSARILLTAPLEREDVESRFSNHIVEAEAVEFSGGTITARRRRLYGSLVLSEHPVSNPDPEAISRALVDAIRKRGLASLPWSKEVNRWRARIGYLHQVLGHPWPDVSDEHLLQVLDDWLAPYLAGKRSLQDIGAADLKTALDGLLPHDRLHELDRLAPSHFEAPTGSRVPVDYSADPGPRISIRVQELFGLDTHPAIARGQVPLVIELLSPAHRPIQLTRDLPGFWQGSWADVKAEMKGRYPKHPWPDNPAMADPTRRAKPRG